MMAEKLPPEFIKELKSVCKLHEQAVCNKEKYREFSETLSNFLVRLEEFSETLSNLLIRLEDMKYYRTADRIMSILINCSSKEASHCEKVTLVGERMKESVKEALFR